MKKFITLNNLFTLLVLVFLAYMQGPNIIRNFRSEGIKLETNEYQIIYPNENKQTVLFPPVNSNGIAIFWATWCGPCKIEMQRLKSSVDSGKISKHFIFAINPFESPAEIRKFLSENKFPFTFIEAPEITRMLNVNATPTTVFLKNGRVSSVSSGLSLIGIWRAEIFL